MLSRANTKIRREKDRFVSLPHTNYARQLTSDYHRHSYGKACEEESSGVSRLPNPTEILDMLSIQGQIQKFDVRKVDLSVYLIPIMLDNLLVTIIDIPMVGHVKKKVVEYQGYLILLRYLICYQGQIALRYFSKNRIDLRELHKKRASALPAEWKCNHSREICMRYQ